MLSIRFEQHTNQVSFNHQTLTRNSVYPHWHDNLEFLHCTDGGGSVILGDKFYTFKKGDTICINSKCLHIISSDETLKCYCLIIDRAYFKENGFNITNMLFEEHTNDVALAKLFRDAHDAYTNTKEDNFTIPEKTISLLSLLLYLCRKHSKNQSDIIMANPKKYDVVLNTIDYISKNFYRKLTLESISQQSGYSKFHFSRLFKEQTGFTVIEYINTVRCNNSKLLLKEKGIPISTIAIECGYDNTSYFAKEFKRQFKMSPSQYRKLIHNKVQ